MFKITRKNITVLLLIITIVIGTVAITGCITDQSGTNVGPGVNGGSNNADLTGIWYSQFLQGTSGHITNGVSGYMYVSPDNEAYLLIPGTGNSFSMLGAAGRFTTSGSTITASLTIYDDMGKPSGTLYIKNGIIQKDTTNGQSVTIFTGEYNGDAESFTGSGSCVLGLEDQYNRPSSLSTISGNWFFFDSDGKTTFSIDSTGIISGGNEDGCVFSGSIDIIDPKYNLYDISHFEISNCDDPWYGNYKGLVSLPNPTGLEVVFLKTDGSFGFTMRFSR